MAVLFLGGTADDTAIALIQLSISWLIVGFITHLFLRSFWVAYIGLSYVYQDKINYNKLKYHKIYLRKLEKNNRITPNIERLEKVCSTIFAVSILFFMNVLGLIFFTCVVIFCIYSYKEFYPISENFDYYFNIVLTFVFLICVIDYLTSGLLKRIPYVNKVFYPIYKIVSIVLLAPLYRKIYYTFITNHQKWKVFLFFSIFIVVSFFSLLFIRDGFGNSLTLEPSEYAENMMSPNHYLDEANGNYSNVIWIPSQTIAAQTLEVFVVHTPAFEENHIKPICNYDNRIQKDNLGINSIKLDCLNQFYELRLNDQTVNSDVFYTKSYKTNQNGLKHFIPIDSLDRGKHTLKLYYNFYNKGKDSIYSRLQSKIEFYKESPKIED